MPNIAIEDAFNGIYDATSRAALVYLSAKCANSADIADLFQETYAEVFAALQKRGPDFIQTPKAFVLRVARQKLSRHYGLLQRLRNVRSLTDECAAEAPPPDDWIDERLVTRALVDRAEEILAQKSVAVQKIFRLHYSLELTIPEIAEMLQLTQSDVKNKLYRTLAELRRQLTQSQE